MVESEGVWVDLMGNDSTTATKYDAAVDNDFDPALPEQWYASLEENYVVETSKISELGSLGDAAQNEDIPIHSWFNLKEAFSFRFPNWVIDYLARNYGFRPECALDPFCGGGTTAITLSRQGIDTVGIEYNPFIAWVAKAKSMWWAYNVEEIRSAVERLNLKVPIGTWMKWPQLTTLKNAKYFRRNDVRTLLYTLTQIAELGSSDLTKQFLRMGVATAVESVANLRKDGRALRYVQKADRPSAKDALLSRWQRNIKDLEKLRETQGDIQCAESDIWRGDARNLRMVSDPWNSERQVCLFDSSFDLILYSPPYLNNFDYSEIYKLELWILGFLQDYEEWREMRRGTIRSHHSVKFEQPLRMANDSTMAEIYEKLKSIGRSSALRGYARENMPPLILGYFDDMCLSLKEQFRVLRSGGFLVYMVANSRHSDLPIATDAIIGELAKLVGFEQLELIVLHKRNGRTRRKKFLRESAMILRKPS